MITIIIYTFFLTFTGFLATFTSTSAIASEEVKDKRAKHRSVRLSTTTKMNYYLQDPTVMSSVGELETPVYLNNLRPLLEDADIKITRPVLTSQDGNFIFNPETPDFDAASVFAITRTTLNMYRTDLSVLSSLYPHNQRLSNTINYWKNGTYGKLLITPEAGIGKNAFYMRDDDKREMKFFTFTNTDATPIHACRSSEIVAHEAGHSILDILKPQYYGSQRLETVAYHESFGDMTALFWTLSHPYLCRLILKETKGDLHKSDHNFLTAVGEQFGQAIGLQNGIRNADENIHVDDAEKEPHSLGTVFTGAIYDTLVDAYEEASRKLTSTESKAKSLFNVAQHLRQMTLYSVVNLSTENPGFSDLSHSLRSVFKQRKKSNKQSALDTLHWSTYIKTHFNRRGIEITDDGSFYIEGPAHVKYGICSTNSKRT